MIDLSEIITDIIESDNKCVQLIMLNAIINIDLTCSCGTYLEACGRPML